jgi:hypothetical protein
MVLEYAEKGSLEEIIKKGKKFTEKQILNIIE